MTKLDAKTIQYLESHSIRVPRPDLTAEEMERLIKYGSLEFKSAGAKRLASVGKG